MNAEFDAEAAAAACDAFPSVFDDGISVTLNLACKEIEKNNKYTYNQ